ncbi:single-stranded DNA-binding domain protein [Mycobacterium ulcerans str. Harvey]|uniref:Single-stranded DNA-binding protein n=8 Tax=Mycobacterium ulcerans group TaxID=2993898 RepID=A0ABP3AQQ8_MYCUL|nr:single-stranded DNA-binding domain protein [Mycobacterium ulcerans str. Harvey]
MAGDTTITVVGNLTADPELRFTPSGAAVANFTVASTPRIYDRQSGEWKDGEALFLRCNIWREAAENVAESLTRGARVIVSGRLKQRSFETREGEKRTVVEVEVEEIGPSLRYATAKVNKASRGGGGGGFGGGGGGGARQAPAQASSPAGATTRGAVPRHRVRSAATTNRPSEPTEFQTSKKRKETDTWPSPTSVVRLRRSRSRRANASFAPRKTKQSTTRTPRCCGPTSVSAARSVPAGSPATVCSTSVTSPWR